MNDRKRDAESLKAKFGALNLELLTKSIAALPEPWRIEAERRIVANERKLNAAREDSEKKDRARELAAYQVGEAEKDVRATDLAFKSALAVAGLDNQMETRSLPQSSSTRWQPPPRPLRPLEAREVALEEDLRVLDREASTASSAATAHLEAVQAKRKSCFERQAALSSALDAARGAFHTARGEADALRKVVDSADCAPAAARVNQARADLGQYAGDPLVSAEQVAGAERAESDAKDQLDQLRAELNQAEGALTKVGGVAIREELVREEKPTCSPRERRSTHRSSS